MASRLAACDMSGTGPEFKARQVRSISAYVLPHDLAVNTPDPSDEPQLTRPLRDLEAWTAHFRAAQIPVLAQTSESLEALRANEDNADASSIGEMISSDPLMTLKVLAHASTHRSSRAVTDIETVIAALVMMGISPFFAAFGQQPTIEDRLALNPSALAGLGETLRRAHRSANYALAFAVHRRDADAAMIHAAASLHDFAEMLLWCHAPALALQIQLAQRNDGALRSSAAQLSVLNIELPDLQQSLMRSWRLPELLIRISDDRHAQHPSVRSVTLAVRLARHTAQGWDNPATPDDVKEIAALLNMSQTATLLLLEGI
jgi:HD-like signal output (HDOD) protein